MKKVYYSPRGNALLYTGEPLDVPVVTLESYEKWYELFVVNPDGTVSAVDVSILQEAQEKDSKAQWIDHDFHPRMLYRVAEILKGCTHDVAVEVAAGRWAINHWKVAEDFHEPEPLGTFELYAEKEGCNNSQGYGSFESLDACKIEMERLAAAGEWPGADWYAVAEPSDESGDDQRLVNGEWRSMRDRNV